MTTLEPFDYIPLQRPESQIRLLEVSAGLSEHSIQCRLTSWNDTEAPPYHAVSYTWGSSKAEQPRSQILVNEKPIRIRKNCSDALKQLLYFRPAQYYWIDALCINQQYVHEKNHQVAKMGRIYSKAEHVIVCLGEYEDDAEYAFDLLSQRASQEIGAGVSTTFEAERLLQSLQTLASRPYFERVWTVQEFILGYKVTMYCGHSQLTVERALPSMIDALAYAAAIELKSSSILRLLDLRKFQALLQLRRSYWERDQRSNWSLQNLSSIYAELKCQDPRDHVYGMLGLVDWANEARIEANYGKSLYDLAAECALVLKADFREAGITRAIAPLLERLEVTVLDRELDDTDSELGWLRKAMFDETYKLFVFNTNSDRTREMIGVPMYGIRLTELPTSDLELPQNVSSSDWILYSRQYHDCVIARKDYDYDHLRRWQLIGRAKFNQGLNPAWFMDSVATWPREGGFVTFFDLADVKLYRDGVSPDFCLSQSSSYVVDVSMKPGMFEIPWNTDL